MPQQDRRAAAKRMTIMQEYYIIDNALCVNHGQCKGERNRPIYKAHPEGKREFLTLADLQIGQKFRYGAAAAGCWDLHGYQTKFGYQPRHVDRFEGESVEKGQYFYVDREEPQNCDCYVAVSEVRKIAVQEVYVPSDFVWTENGYVFVPWGAKERPADGNPAKYELLFTKVTVELKLHGRAKFEVATEVTENSMRIYRVYEPI